jgi:copper chaperone CopZ
MFCTDGMVTNDSSRPYTPTERGVLLSSFFRRNKMRTIRLNIYFLTAAILLGFACNKALAESVNVEVNGMVCGFCAQGISKKLHDTGTAAKVDVDLDKKIVFIEFEKGKSLDDNTLRSIIVDSGYQVVRVTRNIP